MRFPPTPLDPNDPCHEPLLRTIQGNIIKSHGRKHTALVFFRFQPDSDFVALRKLAADRVTSAYEQYQQARRREAAIAAEEAAKKAQLNGVEGASPPEAPAEELFCSFGLTQQGFETLAPNEKEQLTAGDAANDRQRAHPVFWAGMEAQAASMHDQVDAETPKWTNTFLPPPDGVWLLAHAERPALEREVEKLEQDCAAATVRVPCYAKEYGAMRSHEPFGFADGLARSRFMNDEASGGYWANLPLTQVLFEDRGNHSGGSFLVVRKLEQNVAAFRAFEQRIATAFTAAGVEMPVKEAGALLFGRHRDGTPLVADPNKFDTWKNGGGFASDRSGNVCPFHAHVRKANPRASQNEAGGRRHDQIRSVQFVRRSVVYGSETVLDDALKRGKYPDKGVGLLFMAYMSSIDEQFNIMAAGWMTDPNFPKAGQSAVDPLVHRENDAWEWTCRGKQIQVPFRAPDDAEFKPFVVPKGGAYFYLPPIPWLKNQLPPPPKESLLNVLRDWLGAALGSKA